MAKEAQVSASTGLPTTALSEDILEPAWSCFPHLAERLQVRIGDKRAILEVPLTFLMPVLPLELELC